jgi:UDPglucose 6-dehydrogenase
MQPSVAIIGYGDLGRALHALFPAAVIYDEPLAIGARDAASACSFAFVAVPTPPTPDGACDVSIVEHVVGWLDAECIVIASTVAVGTTERLAAATGKRIVFQPHYGPGSTPNHPYADLRDLPWITLGGAPADTEAVAALYGAVYDPSVTIRQTDARSAELAKYMENAYLALKVTFCNELHDLACALGVDYDELRDLWLLDPRIGPSHTLVYDEDRGYDGKCLPKDVSAIIQTAIEAGVTPSLLQATVAANQRQRAKNVGDATPRGSAQNVVAANQRQRARNAVTALQP